MHDAVKDLMGSPVPLLHCNSTYLLRSPKGSDIQSSLPRSKTALSSLSWRHSDENRVWRLHVRELSRSSAAEVRHSGSKPLQVSSVAASEDAAGEYPQGGVVELQQKRRCECHDLFRDLVPYVDAWRWQKLRVEEVRGLGVEEDVDDTLVILQHPPVYTLGTRSSEAFLKFDAKDPHFELHRTERGGEVTYHGPGQLVMYPILNLRHHTMDLHWYLRTLEDVVIGALDKACGIQARRIDGLTGVWVGDRKVAAIGVRVSRWITYHGLALNVTTDLAPFSNIIPCGISDYAVTSVAKLLEENSAVGMDNRSLVERVHDCLLSEFEERFKVQLVQPTRTGPNLTSCASNSEIVMKTFQHEVQGVHLSAAVDVDKLNWTDWPDFYAVIWQFEVSHVKLGSQDDTNAPLQSSCSS